MKIFKYIHNFTELTRVVGLNDAAILVAAHVVRKASPALGAAVGKRARTVRPQCCARPVFLRLGMSDLDVFRQVFIYEEYAPCARLDNVRTIVDCGANIGLTSMYLLDRYPSAKVLAIEPDAANAAQCRRNLQAYGDRAQVECVGVWPQGGWEKPAPLRIDRTFGDHREWAIAVRAAHEGEQPDSWGVSMQAICDRIGFIDLLKIDIEGAEALIFSDTSAAWLSRVGNIAIELHSDMCRQRFDDALTPFAFESLTSRQTVFVKNLRPAAA